MYINILYKYIKMTNLFKDPIIIDALFYLLLGLIRDFINLNMINKDILTQLKNNNYFKYIFLFIGIYFTNSYIQKKKIKDTLINSIKLFVMIILLLKNNFNILLLVIFMLIIHKLIDQYTKELDNQKNKNQKKIKDLNNINYYILHVNITLMVMGFVYNNYDKIKLKLN
jgi:hypothetical protein